MDHPNYFSIIPATVRYDYSLTMTERMLFSEITALSNKYGYCTAGNSYFAKLYRSKNGKPASKQSVSRWIRHLKDKGYIHIDYEWNDSKTVETRRIYPQFQGGINNNVNPPKHSSYYPLNKNVKGNNTRENNTRNINLSSSISPQKGMDEEKEINFKNKFMAIINESRKSPSVPSPSEWASLDKLLQQVKPNDVKAVAARLKEQLNSHYIDKPWPYLLKMLREEK